MINEKKLEQYKKAMLERRAELTEEITRRNANDKERENFTVGDSVDEAENAYEMDLDLSMKESLVRQVKEIDEALERMKTGAFGVCESCGEEIPAGRLKVRPNAIYCTRCAAENERKGPVS